MTPNKPVIVSADGRRAFAAFTASVVVYIVDDLERILMLASPKRHGAWEVINGAMDADESILTAVLRETAEEAGPDVRVRPLGTIHAYTFRYDATIPHMISIAYLCAYEGGDVVPGDDMAGSEFRWWSLAEIAAEQPQIIVPGPEHPWLLTRAVDLHHWLKDQPPVVLQPDFSQTKNKYGQ